MTKHSSHRSSKEVVAATAGLDNWKTWAGRTNGGDDFEVLDLFRGFQRKFAKRFLWKIPNEGTACPVCYTEPDSRHEWYITSACGHAVCIDCLQQYAASQVNDPEHKGPLKCPVCSLPLREKDAIAAMKGNDDIIKQWDSKIRDEFLRALPNYRHCPRCAGNSVDSENDSTSEGNLQSLKGGGFVTAECLAPLNTEREQSAQQLLDLEPFCNWLSTGTYILYLVCYAGNHSTSLFVDLFNSIVPLWLMHRLNLLSHLALATYAKQALLKPIVVECPCCDEAFILNAEAELSPNKNSIIGDEATRDWIGNNTRPCPSCSARISKNGGCNHMRCPQCKADFCWACMRLRTFCAPYSCNNGAPYGNVGPNDTGDNNNINGAQTMADRLRQMENEATAFNRWDIGAFFAIVIGVSARESKPVQAVATVAITAFAMVFSYGFVMTALLLYVLLNFVALMVGRGGRTDRNRERQSEPEPEQQREEQARAPHRAYRFQRRRRDQATEEHMVAEAIRRSLEEY